MKTTHQLLAEVIAWTVKAAQEHVNLARHNVEPVDPETSTGLWQSFQAAFPKTPGIDYDVLVTAYSHTYTETVKALDKAVPECEDCRRMGNPTLVVCGKHENDYL